MLKQLKKYGLFILALIGLGIMAAINLEMAGKATKTILSSLKEMLVILPPVFVLLGLLDVHVPRETMVKYMGEGSGLKGIILAFLVGSAAAGPLYVVFPVAGAFMKKGAKFSNILVMIGAWSTTKIPMLMFEFSSLGPKFMLTRLAMNIPIILIMTLIINSVFSKKEKEEIAERASSQA
jgi:uncharacterized membrane protein YraQ (UPF0718 family)